jgi:hypothetical protein
MENDLYGNDLFTLGNFLIDIDVGTHWVGASTVRWHYDGVVLSRRYPMFGTHAEPASQRIFWAGSPLLTSIHDTSTIRWSHV